MNRSTPALLVAGAAVTALLFGTVGAAGAAPSGLPRPPKQAVLVDHKDRPGVSAGEYRATGISPGAVTKHYRTIMKKRGFAVRMSHTSRGYSYLTMKKGDIQFFVGSGANRSQTRVRFEVCKGTNKLQVQVCGV